MTRMMTLTCALAVAMFGPILLHNAPNWLSDQPKSAAQAGTPAAASSAAAAAKPVAAQAPSPTKATPTRPVPLTPQLEGLPIYNLADVFRFDITPGWIMHRWSRVSAGLGNLQLQGYRVPLVTGTSEEDLAGSLTYYFNPSQQVQQITFSGTTGNAQRLVQLVTTRYHFARRVTNTPGEFIYEVAEPRGEAKSVLKVRPASILTANQPRERFDVSLVITRPAEEE